MTTKVNIKKLITLLILLVSSALSGFLHLPIIPGIDFFWGSIVTVVIILTFGPWWGIAGAILSSIYTIFLWSHPFALIIFVIEAAVIGFIYEKTKKNIALIDVFFWLFIGIPLVVLFYQGIMGLSWPVVKLILLKQIINGVFNSLLGSIIVYVLYTFSHLSFRQSKIRFSNLIYNILMLFVLIPIFGFLIYHGQSENNSFREKTIQTINLIEHDVTQDIQFTFNYHMTPITQLADTLADTNTEIEEVQKKLDLLEQSLPDLSTIYVADENGKTIAFAPQVNEKGESTIGLDFSDREYFRLLKEKRQPVVSDVFMARGGVFEPIVNFNAPILRDNKFIGFVSGSVNLTSVTRILQAISNDEVYISILDSKQQIVATTVPNLKPLDVHTLFSDYNKVPIDNNIYYISKEKSRQSKLSLSEESYYVYINKFFESNYAERTLLIQIPMESLYTVMYKELSEELLFALFVLFIALIAGRLTSRKMVLSLQKITYQAEDLPAKITNSDSTFTHENWLESNIHEVSSLVKVFEVVENSLYESFSEIRSNEAKFKYLAHHDSLTGLPNKLHFIRDVSKRLKSSDGMKAIMFIDLDRFKVVNDMIGHFEGDKVLVQVSNRLRGLVMDGDYLARLGGDEFIICLSIADLKELNLKADKLLEELSKPFDLGDWRFNITATIGISIYPLHGENIDMLIRNADMTMYAAKEVANNRFCLFEEKLLQNIEKREKMEKRLSVALQNQELEIFYQPLYSIRSLEIYGTEALLRWRNPETNNYIYPLEFIPLAEETGMIIPIGEWVLKTATKQIVQWQKDTDLPLSISVNVSAKQFMDENFVKIVSEALEESGLTPKYLILEITESNVMEHLELAISKMDNLKSLGVKLALDDFGTGYSSLSYLKQFPLDTLKIDRTFISDILTNKNNEILVKAVIEVAHTFNLTVVAEGIELDEQLKVVRELKCDFGQGYLLSKPLSTQQFEQMLKKKRNSGKKK